MGRMKYYKHVVFITLNLTCLTHFETVDILTPKSPPFAEDGVRLSVCSRDVYFNESVSEI